MNERIRELLDEAQGSIDPMDQDANVFEKFAELIVRECANYINERTLDWDAELRWIFNDGSGDMAVDVDDLLNRHFGVEESSKAELKHKCSVCGTTKNVEWVGGHQPYLCDSPDCIPF